LLLNSAQGQETALILAANKGSMGTVRKPIQHGASVNITNKVTPCTLCFVCVTPGSSLYTGNWTQPCPSCTYVIESHMLTAGMLFCINLILNTVIHQLLVTKEFEYCSEFCSWRQTGPPHWKCIKLR